MTVADLAAGDFTVGVHAGIQRDKCCVVILLVDRGVLLAVDGITSITVLAPASADRR
jgi:hypothetical protein